MFLYLKKRVFEHVMKDLEMSIDYPGCGHQPRSANADCSQKPEETRGRVSSRACRRRLSHHLDFSPVRLILDFWASER